jgi:serine/threonine protein kinase
MRSKDHVGTYCYSALESLKEKQYSKKSDMFSLGATVFEWDTQLPFIYSTIIPRDDVKFCIEVHEQGRLLEKYEDGECSLLTDSKGGHRRESLTKERSRKSRFTSVLDRICDINPDHRSSAEEVMCSTELEACLSYISSLLENGISYMIPGLLILNYSVE